VATEQNLTENRLCGKMIIGRTEKEKMVLKVIPIDELEKAAENRKRIEEQRRKEPYYWWEYPDVEYKQEASNPRGLAQTRKELKERNERSKNGRNT